MLNPEKASSQSYSLEQRESQPSYPTSSGKEETENSTSIPPSDHPYPISTTSRKPRATCVAAYRSSSTAEQCSVGGRNGDTAVYESQRRLQGPGQSPWSCSPGALRTSVCQMPLVFRKQGILP